MSELKDLATPNLPNWCPGCGNFTIWAAFKNAAVAEGWDNSNTVMVADIGCNGHIVNFTKLTSFEGLHGRPLPVATGIKLANHNLNVFAFTGDGGCIGEGGNHFVHAARRNHDITAIVHDNAIYALTTGQTSPVTFHGYESKSTPQGNPDNPISPVTLAIGAGATFVAREYSNRIPQLQALIQKANAHKGFAVIDILQPCVTFHEQCTHTFYQEHIYDLSEDYDPTDRAAAFAKSLEWGDRSIPVGIFYQEDKPSYESQLPQLADKPLIDSSLERKDLQALFSTYI